MALAPGSAEMHAALGFFHAGQGAAETATPALERARNLGAWSPLVDLELGRQLLSLDRRAEALELLRPLAADSHHGEIAQQSRALLDGS